MELRKKERNLFQFQGRSPRESHLINQEREREREERESSKKEKEREGVSKEKKGSCVEKGLQNSAHIHPHHSLVSKDPLLLLAS